MFIAFSPQEDQLYIPGLLSACPPTSGCPMKGIPQAASRPWGTLHSQLRYVINTVFCCGPPQAELQRRTFVQTGRHWKCLATFNWMENYCECLRRITDLCSLLFALMLTNTQSQTGFDTILSSCGYILYILYNDRACRYHSCSSNRGQACPIITIQVS